MPVQISDYPVGVPLQVDWMRMTPYATPCSFTSRVIDAGQAVTWNTLAWTALTPAGTTLAMSYRTGNTPTPDATWTAFTPVSTSGGALTGSSRYLQYAAQLATSDTTQTPVLEDVTVTYLLCSPPTISGNPSSSTNCVGDAVAFAATATGVGLTYQWQKDGTNLDGAMGSSYSITSVTVGDAGVYDVVVSGPCGLPATSSPATLTVNTGPTITCPSNIVVPAAPNQCSSDVTFAVTATGSPAPTVEYRIGSTVITSPYTFPVGTTTVNCTASDSCGIATCSFTVTVTDVTPPALSLTAPAGASADTNCQAAVPAVVYQVSDTCDTNPSVTQSPVAGTLVGEGATTITVVATDASGNTTTRTTIFTVSDTTPPVISWSFTNLVLETSGDSCQTNMIDVTGTNYVVAYDSCSGTNLILTQEPTNGAVLMEGTNAVVIAVADQAGNTNYSTNTIVVEDTTPPSANVPAEVVQANDPGQCGAVVNFTLPMQTDNCGVAGQEATPASGSFFAVGTTPVTLVVTDIHGNSSTNTFHVTVNDTEPPVIVTHPITITLDAGGSYTLMASDVANMVAGSSDNCGVASTNVSRDTFGCNDVGTQMVQVTLTDVHGNSSMANVTVIVSDLTPPVVVVHPLTVTLDASGNYTLIASDIAALVAGSSDNCGIAGTNVSPTHFTFCDVGAPTVQVTLTNVHGNISTADAMVNVQAPASLPTVVYVDASYGTNCGAVTFPNSNGSGTDYIGYTAFNTIQSGVNAVAAGGIVLVAAGTYPEVIIVNKSLTLLGAQAGWNANSRFAAFVTGSNGPKADPAMESILTAAAAGPANAGNDALHIMADNVTVDGFVLDGNNPTLSQNGAVAVGGINTYVRRAIETEDEAGNFFPANHASIQNNIIQNFAQRGIELVNPTDTSPATSGGLITGNVIRNFGLDGILLANNAYGDIVSNTVDMPEGAEAGIWLQDFPDNGALSKTLDWSHNTVTVCQDAFGGIWANLFYAAAATLNIHDNTVNAAAAVTGDDDYTFGIYLSSLQGGTTANLTNNLVGTTGGQFARGIALWNVPTTTRTTVTGGAVGHALKGVSLHYNDPNFGPAGASYAVDLSAVSISGTDVGILVEATNSGSDSVQMQISDNTATTGCSTGISVLGASAAANVQNNSASITGNGIGILVDTGKALIENNDLTGNLVAGILATNGAVVDAGNCGADVTGFGASAGGNNLSGYLAGSAKAVINANPGGLPIVLADHDNFGATSPADNLLAAFSGPVDYSQNPAVLSCPGPVTVTCVSDVPVGANSLANFIAQGGYYSAGTASVSFSDTPHPAGNGAITRTYTIADACGLINTCTQVIIVSNTNPPAIASLPDLSFSADPGQCSKGNVTWTVNAVDYCGQPAGVISIPPSGSTFNTGTTVVTNIATDNSGNMAITTFKVTVTDVTPPALSLTAPAGASADTNCQAAVPAVVYQVSDTCDTNPSVTQSPVAGTLVGEGTTTITVVATDASGNTTTRTTIFTVSDTTPPVISWSFTNLVLETSGDSCQTNMIDVTGTNYVVAYDSCSGTNLILTQEPTNGAVLMEGTNAVVIAVADQAGNTNYSTNTIVVEDTTPPSANVPAEVVQANDPGQCGAVVNFTLPTQTDNCGVAGQEATPASGSFFAVGTTPVTLVVTDIHGNSSTNTFHVTVNDVEPPSANVPAEVVQANDPGQCGAVVNFTLPAQTDNCGVSSALVSPASGSFFAVGTTPVTLVVTDIHGNSSTNTFHVTVNDVEPPSANVPAEVVQANDPGQCGAVVNFTLPAQTDNCGVSSALVSPASGSSFPVGSTPVAVVVTDIHGNSRTNSFQVTVNDTEPPLIQPLADVIQGVDAGKDYATVTFIAHATDNCGVADLIATPASGSHFPIGTNIVVVVATDIHGNSSTNTFMVEVLAPVTILTQPTNQSVYVGVTASFSVTASGAPPLTYQWNFNQTNLIGATNAILVLTTDPTRSGGHLCGTRIQFREFCPQFQRGINRESFAGVAGVAIRQ